MFNTTPENLEFLKTILEKLTEGVVVCDRNAGILFHNRAALDLLGKKQPVDRQSLLELCSDTQTGDNLNDFLQRQAMEARFSCRAEASGDLLECRLTRIRGPEESVDLFLLLFEAATGANDLLPDSEVISHCAIVEELRAPLANLRAAAENLMTHQDMSPVMRSAFENVIAQESTTLTKQFETMTVTCRAMAAKQHQLKEFFSAELLNKLTAGFVTDGPAITVSGAPDWLLADSDSIVEVMEVVVRLLADYCVPAALQIRQGHHNRYVYLDFIWQGKPVPSVEIKAWRLKKLRKDFNHPTVAEVLRRHSSDIWSQQCEREGYAMLRLPLPAASWPADEPTAERQEDR